MCSEQKVNDREVAHFVSGFHVHVTSSAKDGASQERVFFHHPSALAMTQPDRQPRSGLATIRRDFSSNKTVDPSTAPSLPTTRRSTLSDSLRKAIQDGVASREAEKAADASSLNPQKHALSIDAVPQHKKRRLPSSWTDSEQSSASSPYGSSQSSQFSTASGLRSDSTAYSYHEEGKSTAFPARPSKPLQKPDIQLSYEQKQVLDMVKKKENVFYTGSAGASSIYCLLSISKVFARFRLLHRRQAGGGYQIWSSSLSSLSKADLSQGTGKSVLLREIIKTLRKVYVRTPDAVAVTASTGDLVLHTSFL